MSYNFTFLAIEGDHRDKVGPWCEATGYVIAGAGHEGPTIDVSSRFAKGYTLISDGDVFEEAFLMQLSAKLDSRIVQVVCGGTAASYGIACCESGKTIRVFCVSESEILEDTGRPIAEEAGLSFDASTSEGEMLAVAARFGFDPNQVVATPDYRLVLPYASLPESAKREYAGRVVSTLVCTLVAIVFFRIAPRTPGLSWPVELLMMYGFAATLYVAIVGSLRWVIPDRWRDRLDDGVLFQLRFAVAFWIALFVFKMTGVIGTVEPRRTYPCKTKPPAEPLARSP